jgi:hypothetical protein
MPEQDEFDQISRGLDSAFVDFYTPPGELDLRGVDPATFALGLCYGFDNWEDVRVVANSRRNVAMAKEHWTERHPTIEFLSHVVGADEQARGHRALLDRAHPGCPRCLERLDLLSVPIPDRVEPDSVGLDRVADAAAPDAVDLAWLQFQYADAKRSSEEAEASGPLNVPGRAPDEAIRAQHFGDGDWYVTVRHPSAHRATVWIEWDNGEITEHTVIFQNDVARIDAEAPDAGVRPARVRVQITDPPGAA